VYVAVSSSGPYNELAVANADGSSQTPLLSSDQVGYFFPAWSPDLDSNQAGFQGSVVFEEWSGSVTEPIISLKLISVIVSSSGVTAGIPELLVQNASAPAWSPQGDKIAYVSHQDGQKGIHIIDPISKSDVLLIPGPTPEDNTSDVNWPAWNPDGTRLAYTWVDETQVEQIRIREVLDETGQLVLNGHDFPLPLGSPIFGPRALDWSRFGGFIAFKASGAMQLVNAATGEMETLPDTTWAESPTWMPTSESELVFMNRNGRSGAGKRKIVVRNLTTQAETVIVERNGFHLYEPDWQR
jgi:Tol biopolymer transport system component